MMMTRFALLFCGWSMLLLCFQLPVATGFNVEKKHLAGIWKLQLDGSFAGKAGKTMLIKIQEDGSFEQCDEDDQRLHGNWEYEDTDCKLQLAFERHSHTASGDLLLAGKVASDDGRRIQNGVVSEGKFMYPPPHPAFFDQVLAASEVTGKFSLKQVMGFNQLLGGMQSDDHKKEESEPEPAYKPSDFFGKRFFMTVVPIECKIKPPKEWDKQRKSWFNPLDDQAADIRTMPIQFFANATFEAIGINNILRGRYEITEDDKLWFRVSRFGMGRSTPGSVFSEGPGLSHEDERTYLGVIEERSEGESRVSLRVEGKVTFGNDLGSDARPEPVGTFLMHEVEDVSLDMRDDDDDDDDDDKETNTDVFDSIFE